MDILPPLICMVYLKSTSNVNCYYFTNYVTVCVIRELITIGTICANHKVYTSGGGGWYWRYSNTRRDGVTVTYKGLLNETGLPISTFT